MTVMRRLGTPSGDGEMMRTIDVAAIEQALLRPRKERRMPVQVSDLLSTGSTLLNLACTGRVQGGFIKGHYYLFCGDSDSGKTFLTLTCLAEASVNKHFKDYRFIYDGGEYGALMNIEKFFGKGVADRIEPPATDEDNGPVYSQTVEEFYFHVDDAIKDGRPFIYIQDSQDSLSSTAEIGKFDEWKEAFKKGKETTGSYGDNKAKIHSAGIRQLLGPLQKTGSILIVLNQTRDSFKPFEEKTYSGGRALKFYATLQLWASVKEKIKRTVKGKLRQLGIRSRIRVKKNRITGKDRQILVPIYHSFGIDDIGSCIDYLVEEKHWPKKGAKLKAEEFEFVGTTEQLITLIENGKAEMDLREIVADVWNGVEKACEVKRKSRY